MNVQVDENGQPVQAPASSAEAAQVETAGSEAVPTPEVSETGGDEAPKQAPLHEHPRFKQVISDNRELKRKLEEMESRDREREAYEKAGPEERAIMDLRRKGNFASKEDIARIQKQLMKQADDRAFQDFLKANPQAEEQADVIKALAYTPQYSQATYADVYKALGGGGRKVVATRQKTGMSPKGGGGARAATAGGAYFTGAQIAAMDDATYAKNLPEIKKQMREGKIK